MFEDTVPCGIFENLKDLSGCCNMRQGRGLKVNVGDISRGRSYMVL